MGIGNKFYFYIKRSLYSSITIQALEVFIKNLFAKKTPCQVTVQASFSTLSRKRSFQFHAKFFQMIEKKNLFPTDSIRSV